MKIADRIMSIVMLAGLPRPLQVGIYGLAGVALGMALVLVRIANATSYLSDDPQACINCHVMTDAYASWQRGSHGQSAVCIDCHVPHSSFIAKYAYKAQDGLKHSYVFTRRKEPQVLGLSARAVPVVQTNCVRCHSHQVMMIGAAWRGHLALAFPSPPEHPGPVKRGQDGRATPGRAGFPNAIFHVWGPDALTTAMVPERRCWECHQGIHGKARSLSASPMTLRPGLPDAGLK
jgi:cytochrome c nitrite reductase small subunit